MMFKITCETSFICEQSLVAAVFRVNFNLLILQYRFCDIYRHIAKLLQARNLLDLGGLKEISKLVDRFG